MGLSRTWCQSGEFVLECENGEIHYVVISAFIYDYIPLFGYISLFLLLYLSLFTLIWLNIPLFGQICPYLAIFAYVYLIWSTTPVDHIYPYFVAMYPHYVFLY